MADLDDLLVKTSRTFALAIPLLPEPTRREVAVAYLLFRIADTFEDAAVWPREKRIAALQEFCVLAREGAREQIQAAQKRWLVDPPCAHAGYLELLGVTDEVLAELGTMSPGAREILLKHTIRTAQGMAEVVSRGDAKGNLQLDSVEDLKRYCYIVAGIVGELLTDLFLHDAPALQASGAKLTANTIAFGEGLQLVNILKDRGDDAQDGRVYLPKGVPLTDVFEIARRDLDLASDYVEVLREGKAPRGYQAFTALPVMLARAALDAVENQGQGSKVGRKDVMAMWQQLETTLDAGTSLKPLTA